MSTPPFSSSSIRIGMSSRSTPPPPYRASSPSISQRGSDSFSSSPLPPPSIPISRLTDPPMSRVEASSSTMRRASSSSSSTHQSISSPSTYPTPDVSTAPTSPALTTPITRSWRPTTNVPTHVHRRHKKITSDGGESNRWLSEDEGAGSSTAGVRRRSSMGARSGRRGDRDDRNGDAGPSTRAHRSRGPDKVQTTQDAINVIQQSKRSTQLPVRPLPQRMSSFDSRPVAAASSSSTGESLLTSVGVNPPTIEQLVPPPIASDGNVGLGIRTSGQNSIPVMPVLQSDTSEGVIPLMSSSAVPDFAKGRGGDGIGGINIPFTSGVSEDIDSAALRLEKRKELVDKLSRVLGCALCPSIDGSTPSLHHPITLPCGHTLSSNHIFIPAPPPLHFTNEPPHEIFAAQQKQHAQRLAIWTNVMCPIPTCKRFSPTASASAVMPNADVSGDEPSSESAVSENGAQRTGMLASGVHYYPPAPAPVTTTLPAPPPAYSTENPTSASGSPLLDVTVDKILALVKQERQRLESNDVGHYREEEEETDVDSSSSSDNDDDSHILPSGASQASLTHDFSLLASGGTGSSTLMGRTGSKRRRKEHRPPRRLPRTSVNQNQANDFDKELMGTLECDVCAMLLYEPVTTPCQHSFCSKCLSRSLDHSSRCPVCRQDLPSFAFFQDHAVNKVLLTIIKTAFPEEYVERQQAIERDERDARLDTPIFVCTLAFPGMPTILHVFEPRYRLMIRRCIESTTPRFGMVLPARGSGAPQLQGLMEYGTMLEIQSVQMLPDGRSMVETVGTHRFKLLEKGSLDGYTVGRIERIDDVSPEEEIAMEREAVSRATMSRVNSVPSNSTSVNGTGSNGTNILGPSSSGTLQSETSTSAAPVSTASTLPISLPQQPSLPLTGIPGMSGGGGGPIGPGGVDFAALASQSATTNANADDTPETTEELMAICQAFIDQLRSGSAPWLLQRLNNTYGSMPTDPSEFSYWMALVMPIDEYEKARLLPIRSPRLRLKLIVHWVESLRSSWW
ncbi:uncharacterized protein L201_004524 [Kwoniella dendrophila CBS 6074]|uniref:RING-type domain-containing protein n=1 Tax=Kwoniella dendrophila CBS 6074 TaxID=1295534 RepID=A0AAX4JXG9_9TREE